MNPPTPPPPAPLPPLSNREVRDLKGRAQRLSAVTKLGKGGVSPEFLTGLNRELDHHQLIKLKLVDLKDQRHELGEQIAAATHSHLIAVIGHVIVLYRPKGPAQDAGPGLKTAQGIPA